MKVRRPSRVQGDGGGLAGRPGRRGCLPGSGRKSKVFARFGAAVTGLEGSPGCGRERLFGADPVRSGRCRVNGGNV